MCRVLPDPFYILFLPQAFLFSPQQKAVLNFDWDRKEALTEVRFLHGSDVITADQPCNFTFWDHKVFII